MSACYTGNAQRAMKESFSLEYRVQKGLDCAMTQDCGFQIEVTQTGALTRYDDTGSGTLTVGMQHQLSPQQMTDLYLLLDEPGFFGFPARLPVENPRAGGGSVSVTYVAWPSKTSKSVLIMKGSPLPAEAWTFIDGLDSFFSSLE